MAYVTKTKDPDDVLDYRWDWAADLPDGDTITSATFTVTTDQGAVVPDSDTTPVEVDSYSNTTTTATAWLSGGTLRSSYLVVCHAVTTGGREMDKTLKLKIAQK